MIWQPHIDWQNTIRHLFLIDAFDPRKLNPPIWSLIVEMRICLLFPLLIYFVLKFNWWKNLLGGLLVSLIGYGLDYSNMRGYSHFDNQYIGTTCYVLMFVVGILLAKHRDALKKQFMTLRRTAKYAVFVLTFLAYTNAFWLQHMFSLPAIQKALNLQIIQDLMVTTAVASFIIMALASGKLSRILLFKPFHYLGEISYSFYLYHMICLLAFLYLFYGLLPFQLIIGMAILASFATAALSYHWIEVPFIRLGKHLTHGSQTVTTDRPQSRSS